ncbi:MAG: ribbon-helix-helix domain-containing protein [Chloroflexota bacterium]|jgi:predicted HicB family RNase H-like nuclease|nr:ribbon-helix-helix domain-containing protein [Chloroflexota bacterium]
MAITKRPQSAGKTPQDDQAAEAFIQGAEKRVVAPKRKRKERVMIQIDEDALGRIDTAAERRGVSRSAWINFVILRALDQGEG